MPVFYCYRIGEMQDGETIALPLNSYPRLVLPSTETLNILRVAFLFFFPSINWDYSEYNLLVLDYLASSINLDKVHIIP